MLKFLKFGLASTVIFLAVTSITNAQDIKVGKKVFKKCAACHAVGDGAKNKVGPHLNDLFGKVAGTDEKFKYSKSMKAAGSDGLVWNDETISEFLLKPKKFIKKTKMSFGGLKKDKDRANVIAYLKTFSAADATTEEPVKTEEQSSTEPEVSTTEVASSHTPALAKDAEIPKHGVFKLGRLALKEEVAAWDIDVRPDGKGLPKGKGTVAQGEGIYAESCAVCHGDFGEGIDRWPVLAGGQGTLEEERPDKTIGSYWPYLSTVYDYIRRAMPFGNARSLSDDEVYALTAYVMYLNDIVDDEEFELSSENFTEVRLPNEENFIADGRKQEAHYTKQTEPCMKDCKPEPAKLLMRARVLDVTPDGEGEEGAGGLE